MKRMEILLVSACLLGEPCRYDGMAKPCRRVQTFAGEWHRAGGRVVPVCPEVMGGLPVPRAPADLRGGDGQAVLDGRARVLTRDDDRDVTEAFLRGATLAAAEAGSCRLAILKSRSPSCGVGVTSIEGEKSAGDGVFAALLRRQNVPVCTDEEELPEL